MQSYEITLAGLTLTVQYTDEYAERLRLVAPDARPATPEPVAPAKPARKPSTRKPKEPTVGIPDIATDTE
ncbi:hypothetical protein RCH12_002780 [Cryobacterium sp. MP_3.1]|uniref:hypothetical protein n=1 Tax=Cryobacterium sp. MP_3.1 TaxID=3071711 RepID=UPI002E0690EC|nr:hypothetical protein [Cryobacterium sp. MP_3.1]